MSDHVLRAYLLDGQGGASALPVDHISKADRADGLVWIHIDGNDPAAVRSLEDEISSLDPFIIDALLDEESRPRMTQIGHGALLVLRGVNLNENEDPEDMVSICLWVEEKKIIMVSRTRIRAAGDIEARLWRATGPAIRGNFSVFYASACLPEWSQSLRLLMIGPMISRNRCLRRTSRT